MKNQDYTGTISVNKSALEVFNSVNSVSKWWAKNIEGSSEKQGDVFTVHFGDTFVTFRITESIAGKKVVWHVTDCYLHWLKDKKEWNGTEIVFDISAHQNVTQMVFTHVGLVPDAECYNDCQKGWDQHIKQSLAKLITEGKGNPE